MLTQYEPQTPCTKEINQLTSERFSPCSLGSDYQLEAATELDQPMRRGTQFLAKVSWLAYGPHQKKLLYGWLRFFPNRPAEAEWQRSNDMWDGLLARTG